jgi:hypothetical protein
MKNLKNLFSKKLWWYQKNFRNFYFLSSENTTTFFKSLRQIKSMKNFKNLFSKNLWWYQKKILEILFFIFRKYDK